MQKNTNKNANAKIHIQILKTWIQIQKYSEKSDKEMKVGGSRSDADLLLPINTNKNANKRYRNTKKYD